MTVLINRNECECPYGEMCVSLCVSVCLLSPCRSNVKELAILAFWNTLSTIGIAL
jgi:hypothetical protein